MDFWAISAKSKRAMKGCFFGFYLLPILLNFLSNCLPDKFIDINPMIFQDHKRLPLLLSESDNFLIMILFHVFKYAFVSYL